jgi:AraC-like DNA-binding protein
VAHAFRFSSDSDGYVLTVNAHLLAEGEAAGMGEALQQLFAQPRTLPLGADSPDVSRLQPLFEALHAENSADDAAEAPVPLWLARAVVWRSAQLGRRARRSPAGGARPSRRQALYTRWVVLLESHYREHWPVSRYAEQLGLSSERLNRMVAAETGATRKNCCTPGWPARPAAAWCTSPRRCSASPSIWASRTRRTSAASSSATPASRHAPTACRLRAWPPPRAGGEPRGPPAPGRGAQPLVHRVAVVAQVPDQVHRHRRRGQGHRRHGQARRLWRASSEGGGQPVAAAQHRAQRRHARHAGHEAALHALASSHWSMSRLRRGSYSTVTWSAAR